MAGQAELKVGEIPQQHVGRGRAIVDPEAAAANGWSTGQILEIIHGKKTHAKMWPAGPSEAGGGSILVDGTTRQNAGAGIGDRARVRAVEASDAEQVVLSPTESVRAEGLHEHMAENYLNHVFTVGDAVTIPTRMGSKMQFVVTGTRPARPVIVTDRTAFKQGRMVSATDASYPRVTYDDLGGLGDAVRRIRETVELPMRHPELFEKIGIEAPKGVLLHGPPGTGKTLLARAVAGETNAHFVSLSGPEIMDKHYGGSEEKVREVFRRAEENAPSVVFIDEIDSIAPKRDEVTGEVEKRIVSQLLTLMDGMKSRGKVVVIAATNRPDSLDPALRRPGRFDREIEIGVPDREGRRQILGIHARGVPLDGGADLDAVASATHGYVGADLESVVKEAAMGALRRVLPEIDLDREKVPPEVLQKIRVTAGDLDAALRETQPSALREVLVQVPSVSWDDVGGLEALKEELREAAEWPVKYPEEIRAAGVRPPRGVLLHGPPGTGKTLLAKAVATTTESNFISVKGPELLSKWVGESEKGVREIFRKAKQASPCVVFFDEIDALVPRRSGGDSTRVSENVVSQILTELDGVEELRGVLVVGATNRLDMVDPALLRPGRFDRVTEVPLPDAAAREGILRIHLRGKPVDEGADPARIAGLTAGMSGAGVEAVANGAAMRALRRHMREGRQGGPGAIRITQEDLEAAAAGPGPPEAAPAGQAKS